SRSFRIKVLDRVVQEIRKNCINLGFISKAVGQGLYLNRSPRALDLEFHGLYDGGQHRVHIQGLDPERRPSETRITKESRQQGIDFGHASLNVRECFRNILGKQYL